MMRKWSCNRKLVLLRFRWKQENKQLTFTFWILLIFVTPSIQLVLRLLYSLPLFNLSLTSLFSFSNLPFTVLFFVLFFCFLTHDSTFHLTYSLDLFLSVTYFRCVFYLNSNKKYLSLSSRLFIAIILAFCFLSSHFGSLQVLPVWIVSNYQLERNEFGTLITNIKIFSLSLSNSFCFSLKFLFQFSFCSVFFWLRIFCFLYNYSFIHSLPLTRFFHFVLPLSINNYSSKLSFLIFCSLSLFETLPRLHSERRKS